MHTVSFISFIVKLSMNWTKISFLAMAFSSSKLDTSIYLSNVYPSYMSIHPSINLLSFIHQSVDPFTSSLSTNPSIDYLSFYPSIYLPINLSIPQQIHNSINLYVHFIHLSIYSFIWFIILFNHFSSREYKFEHIYIQLNPAVTVVMGPINCIHCNWIFIIASIEIDRKKLIDRSLESITNRFLLLLYPF